MKKQLQSILLLVLLSGSVFSQIPNPSFELWTNNQPIDWTTNTTFPTIIPVSQSTDSWAGTYAIKGQVISVAGQAYPPVFYSTPTGGPGFSITTTPTSLTGWFKASMVGNDHGIVVVTIYDASSASIGVGYIQLSTNANYSLFTVPIIYPTGGQAAYASINVTVGDTSSQATVGSNMLIDDLSFSGNTSVNEVNSFSFCVKSNPVANQVNFTGNFKSGETYLVKIFDATGKMVLNSSVKSLSNGLSPFDVSSLPEGNYMILISDSQKSFSQKILISR